MVWFRSKPCSPIKRPSHSAHVFNMRQHQKFWRLSFQGSHLTSTMGTIYAIQDTFSIPAPVSSLTLGHVGQLYAGSGEPALLQQMKGGALMIAFRFFIDDGSLRVYDLSTNKVSKAIRGLSGEVSSIVCVKRPGAELRDAWIAHGRMVRPNPAVAFIGVELYRYADLQIQVGL